MSRTSNQAFTPPVLPQAIAFTDEQAMLLRALEEGRFFPMGSDREAESQFQLIAGTNVDLSAAVAFAARAAAITCSRPGADPPWARELA